MDLMELLKTLYGVMGAAYPKASLAAVMVVGAVICGGIWLLIGRQYNDELRRSRASAVPANLQDAGSNAASEIVEIAPARPPAAKSTPPSSDSVARRVAQMRESGYAWIVVVDDSLGNQNENSWGKGSGGDWTSPSRTTVRVGDLITITAKAKSPVNAGVEFRFSLQRPAGGFEVRQDWSGRGEWTWRVAPADIGGKVIVMISVRAAKSYYQFGDADDYTYAIYEVLPKQTSDAGPDASDRFLHEWQHYERVVNRQAALLAFAGPDGAVSMPESFYRLAERGHITKGEAEELASLRNIRNDIWFGMRPSISDDESAKATARLESLIAKILGKSGELSHLS